MQAVRILNDYRVIYQPDHPSAMQSQNWLGYVYEHVVVASRSIGRQLLETEVVHHLDGDRSNNRISNLLVIDRGQHAKLHQWLDSGASFGKLNDEQGKNSVKPKAVKCCVICGVTLQFKQIKTCSVECHSKRVASESTIPSKDELLVLEKTLSREAIGRKYGVSGNAVKKWQRKYGMAIPSRAKDTSLEGVETSGEVKPS